MLESVSKEIAEKITSTRGCWSAGTNTASYMEGYPITPFTDPHPVRLRVIGDKLEVMNIYHIKDPRLGDSIEYAIIACKMEDAKISYKGEKIYIVIDGELTASGGGDLAIDFTGALEGDDKWHALSGMTFHESLERHDANIEEAIEGYNNGQAFFVVSKGEKFGDKIFDFSPDADLSVCPLP
jgi:hypothetical protein